MTLGRALSCCSLAVALLFLASFRANAGSAEVDWTFNGFSTTQITIAIGDEVDIVDMDDTFDLQATGNPPQYFSVDIPPGDYFPYVYNSLGTFSFSDEFGDTVVVVVNPSATVSIVPTNEAVFTAPSTLTVFASPTNGATPYAEVDFYLGTNLEESVFTTPWDATLTNLPAGDYTITVIVTDNDSNIASNSVSISVVAPQSSPPPLTVSGTGSQIVVSWPTTNSAGFSLQASPILGQGASWSVVTPVLVGTQWVFTNSTSAASQFFRLSGQ